MKIEPYSSHTNLARKFFVLNGYYRSIRYIVFPQPKPFFPRESMTSKIL